MSRVQQRPNKVLHFRTEFAVTLVCVAGRFVLDSLGCGQHTFLELKRINRSAQEPLARVFRRLPSPWRRHGSRPPGKRDQ